MSPSASTPGGRSVHTAGADSPLSTIQLESPTLPPIAKAKRRNLVATTASGEAPRSSVSAGGGGAGDGSSAPLEPKRAWGDGVVPGSGNNSSATTPTNRKSNKKRGSKPLDDGGESDHEGEGDGYLLTPELRLKVLHGEPAVQIQPDEPKKKKSKAKPPTGDHPDDLRADAADSGALALLGGSTARRTPKAPSMVQFEHEDPLSLTMQAAATEDGGVDLDRLFYGSDMSTSINAKAFRSEYSFADADEFSTHRKPHNRLDAIRAERRRLAEEAAKKEAEYTKSRPVLADVHHLFPGKGPSKTGKAAKDVMELDVSSRFAERPLLKSVHWKFPGGDPKLDRGPETPTHMQMQDYVEDRRAWEEVGDGAMPVWSPSFDESAGETTPFHRISKMGEYGRTTGEAASTPAGTSILSRSRTQKPVDGVHRRRYDSQAAGTPSPSPSRRSKKGSSRRSRSKSRKKGGGDRGSVASGASSGRRRGRGEVDPTLRALFTEQDRAAELELREVASIPIQKLWRGYRVRVEMIELMQSAVVVQHAFRDLINFRVWRFSVMTMAANRIIRTQRRQWAIRAARKARALQWAREIKAANDVQRCYRGYLGRLIAKEAQMRRQNMLATIIQCGARIWFAMKRVAKRVRRRLRRGEIRTRAAIFIQTIFRGHFVRLQLSWQTYAAHVIQIKWREYVARRNVAALVIQRVWRGHYAWVWVKNWCATKITRVARGALARLWVRKEKQRLEIEEGNRFETECHVVDVAGDVGAKEMTEYLASGRGYEEVQTGAVLLQNESRMLSTQRKEESWQAQLRDTFSLFDVDKRGALDEEQLGDLLKEMCVGVSPDELHAAVVDMDKDGNGLIELEEFTQFFASLDVASMDEEVTPEGDLKDEVGEGVEDEPGQPLGRANMRRKMRLLKWQMKTQQWINEIFLTVYKKLAERAMVAKARDDARRVARVNFRRKFPPKYHCTKCIRCFVFDAQLRLHWFNDCNKLDMIS